MIERLKFLLRRKILHFELFQIIENAKNIYDNPEIENFENSKKIWDEMAGAIACLSSAYEHITKEVK